MTPYTIKYWTDKGHSKEDAMYQISIRRIYNKNYWIHRFGEKIGMEKYYEFITKGTKGKKRDAEYRKTNRRCKEYWKNLGMSDSEAIDKISKIQSTFSLEKCLEKWGNVLGKKKFENRQKKWQHSMLDKSICEINKINKKKDSQSIDFFIRMYGNCWVEKFLDRKVGRGEIGNLIRKCVREFKTKKEFVYKFHEISPKFMVLRRILQSKIIQKIYSIPPDEINDTFLEMLKTYGVYEWKPAQFGQELEYDGIKYKSSGEVEIANFLNINKVRFEYNKKYPNQNRYYYDFFLTDFGYYIEYSGMSGKSFYDKRIENKRKMCLEYGFKCYISKDITRIKDKILNICYENKN